jgi:magnesium chelatase subunit D
VDVTERITTALACSALDRNLAGVLLIDLDPALIYQVAGWLSELLDGEPPLIQIGPHMTEDSLWERFTLTGPDAAHPADLGFRWEAGRLAGYSRRPAIVVVPDLALIGLPAARAAVTLVGADVAHLERSGMSRIWRPRDRWLTTLRRVDVEEIAPHLLDRFAFRIDASAWSLPRDLDPVLYRAVHDRRGAELPGLSAAAAEHAVATMSANRVPGIRRELAIARAARALAALRGDPEVFPGHVDMAAELVGLEVFSRSAGPGTAAGGRRHDRLPPSAGHSDRRDAFGASRAVPGPVLRDVEKGRLPVLAASDQSELLPEPDVAGDQPGEHVLPPQFAGPYPEDEAKLGHDAPLLRASWHRALTGPARGRPFGTRRALDKRDIAIVPTLLNAVRFQRVRCSEHYQEGHALHVRKEDLLSYRRARPPRQMLLLLLDHTCRAQDWDWFGPLEPYLGWAYVVRAVVGVVEVGAAVADQESELRATQFRSRGVLDPRVPKALQNTPGRATPLAHGLTLAAGMLRHSMQLGGPGISDAILVVVTDGRANVPLPNSVADMMPVSVGDAGFKDALAEARKIQALGVIRHRVRSVVIHPGRQPNSHLAAELAVALDAPLEHGTEPGHRTPAGAGGAA